GGGVLHFAMISTARLERFPVACTAAVPGGGFEGGAGASGGGCDGVVGGADDGGAGGAGADGARASAVRVGTCFSHAPRRAQEPRRTSVEVRIRCDYSMSSRAPQVGPWT